MIPLWGQTFDSLLLDKLKSNDPNLSSSEVELLKTVSIYEWAESIKVANDSVAKNSELNYILNKFVVRFSDLVKASKQASGNPDLLVTSWRSLFEVAVVFRVLSQTIIQNSDIKVFQELISRFKDYGILSSGSVFDSMKVEEKYKNANKIHQLKNEYDWLNPAFPEQVAKRFSKPYSPSFRDLISRTRESDTDLFLLTNLYEKASNALHFNFLSDKIISEINPDDLESSVDEVGRVFLYDYLRMVSKLYSVSGNKTPSTDTLIALSSQLSKIIRFR